MLRACFATDEFTPVSRRRLTPVLETLIGRTLQEGLELCGRRFEFLGFSASQLVRLPSKPRMASRCVLDVPTWHAPCGSRKHAAGSFLRTWRAG